MDSGGYLSGREAISAHLKHYSLVWSILKAVITVDPAGKTAFVYSCIQMRLLYA